MMAGAAAYLPSDIGFADAMFHLPEKYRRRRCVKAANYIFRRKAGPRHAGHTACQSKSHHYFLPTRRDMATEFLSIMKWAATDSEYRARPCRSSSPRLSARKI